MYGFCVHLQFTSKLPFQTVLDEVARMSGFFDVKGWRLQQRVVGAGEPHFKVPPVDGEVLREEDPLSLLESPTIELPKFDPNDPGKGPWVAFLTGNVKVDDGGERRWAFRERFKDCLMKLLVVHVGTFNGVHNISFWTESHVWLEGEANPVRRGGDANLLALADLAASIASKHRDQLGEAYANFGQMKGPFRAEEKRLSDVFSEIPGFKPDC